MPPPLAAAADLRGRGSENVCKNLNRRKSSCSAEAGADFRRESGRRGSNPRPSAWEAREVRLSHAVYGLCSPRNSPVSSEQAHAAGEGRSQVHARRAHLLKPRAADGGPYLAQERRRLLRRQGQRRDDLRPLTRGNRLVGVLADPLQAVPDAAPKSGAVSPP